MASYYFNVWFSRRRSINAGHEWIWYIAIWLDISGTDLKEGVGACHPHHLHHHTGRNGTAQSRSCHYLPAQTTGLEYLFCYSLHLPPSKQHTVKCLLLQLHIHSMVRLCQSLPYGHLSFKKKHPDRHNYPAVVSPAVFPCYEACLHMDWYTGCQAQGKNNSSHLVIHSPGVSCCFSWLASVPAQNSHSDKRSLSGSHIHKKYLFVIEVTESSES